MRRGPLILLALALCAVAGASGASAGGRAAGATCSIDRLVDHGLRGGIQASGSCRAKSGSRVAGTWTWTRVAYDSTGTACGAAASHASGSGQIADAGMVPYRLVVSFRLAPRGGGAAAQRTASFVEGDPLVRCADLDSLPLPSAGELCPVAPPGALTDKLHLGQCGIPPARGNGTGTPTASDGERATCAWIGGVTMSGNTVSAGPFACTGGDCTVANQSRPAQGFFGYPQTNSNYVCGFVLGKGYRIGAWTPIGAIQLTDAGGATCEYVMTVGKKGGGANQFQLPPNLGGTLAVTFVLEAAGGYEYETGSFALHGSDGCGAFDP